MSELTMEKLKKVIKDFEESEPQFNTKEIDDMISYGNKIEELALFHSASEVKELNQVKTKHGYLETCYNPYIPYGTMYIMKKPPSDVMDLLHKDYDLKE